MSAPAERQGTCRIVELPLADGEGPMPASAPWLALRRAGAACYAIGYAMLRATARWARDVYRFIAFPFSHCRGVYPDFRRAESAALPMTRIGFDHAGLAGQYRAELYLGLDNSEYPLLYYLERILTRHSTVLDFGGNIGVHYLRFRNYLALDKVRWIVCDVPAITRVGRVTCADIPNIEFINDIDELGCAIDIFLASGSLQYVESHDSLLTRLLEPHTRPGHLLLDHLPLYDGQRFVTLQNGGRLLRYPQYVFNREDYLSSIADRGYELVDSWDCRNASCLIPFHRGKAVRAFSGLYFRVTDDRKTTLSRVSAPSPI